MEPVFERVMAAIRSVHAEHADDLCWMPADVNRIFEAAGLPPQDLRVGDRAAMRRNCDRYVDALYDGGPWRSYGELEAEEVRLRGMVNVLADRLAKYTGRTVPEEIHAAEWRASVLSLGSGSKGGPNAEE